MQTRCVRRYVFGLTHMLTLGIGVCMSKYRLPVLNWLRGFEAAARHRSIAKACEELHVTHAAVSRHIQKLEEQLGQALFERYHKKIVLTEAGEILFGAVAMGFSHIQRAVAQLTGHRKAEKLVISVDPDFAGLWLVPRLADFCATVPDTVVEIAAEKGADSSQNPQMDCAIQYSNANLPLENGELLFRSRLFPVYAPGLLRTPPLRSPEDLRHHVLLHDRSFDEWQEYLRCCSGTIDFNVRSGRIFSETAHCLEAAARGQGVAIGDDFLAGIHLSEGRLVRPFDTAFLSKNAYYFVVPQGGSGQPAVRAFRQWLFRIINPHHADQGNGHKGDE